MNRIMVSTLRQSPLMPKPWCSTAAPVSTICALGPIDLSELEELFVGYFSSAALMWHDGVRDGEFVVPFHRFHVRCGFGL